MGSSGTVPARRDRAAPGRDPARLARRLIREERLEPLLDALADDLDGAAPVEAVRLDGHTNVLIEIRFDDGRALMVKRARTPYSAASFETARLAGRLLRRHTSVLAPTHLDVPDRLFDLPTLVYWRIEEPILEEVWPTVPAALRPDVMRSWGGLVAQIHRIRFPGHGELPRVERRPVALEPYLRTAIGERLRSTCVELLPAAVPVVDRMTRAIPAIARRVDRGGGTLVHNDLHMRNTFCRVDDERFRCIGVLDLEAAFAGPREADLARPQVLYGPQFGNLPAQLHRAFAEGYGFDADPVALAFFRARHLLNLALHFARVGWTQLAENTAHTADGELDRIG